MLNALIVCLILLSLLFPAAGAFTAGGGEPGTTPGWLDSTATRLLSGHNIGYRVVRRWHSGWLPFRYDIALWYPTAAKDRRCFYRFGEGLLPTQLAPDAALIPGRHPLVVYSHGAVGSGLSSFFLAEALARKGYIVAAPDFRDPVYSCRISRLVPTGKMRKKRIWKFIYSLRDRGLNERAAWGRKKYRYRPEQLLETIECMRRLNRKQDSFLYDRLEPGKLALIGHSFGAWTSLLVAGADSRFTLTEPVTCVVSLSSVVNERAFAVQSDNDLASIHAPVLYMYGDREKLIDRKDKPLLFDKSNQPKVLACIEGANHFTFSGGIPAQFDKAADYIRRSAPRAKITELSLDFINHFMKGTRLETALKVRTGGVKSILSTLGASSGSVRPK